jgi:AraC-like DNA-binding protein
MTIENYSPSAILKPFIKAFVIIESEDGMENKILPDTSIIMAFRFKGSMAYGVQGSQSTMPAAVISGLRKSPRIVQYSKKTATLLVKFNEGGAAAFFKEPLHDLFEQSISLDNLFPRYKLIQVEEQLEEAKYNAARISVIERFLISELKKSSDDLLIHSAIQKIKSTNGAIRINELLEDLPISRDPFEKRFRRIIGTSPKQFSTIVRIKDLISIYPQKQSLTDTAHAAGYFDQAHFIKDFKSFTGQTPLTFFKTPPRW